MNLHYQNMFHMINESEILDAHHRPSKLICNFHRKRLRKIFIVHGKNIDGRLVVKCFGEYLCLIFVSEVVH